LQHLLILEMRLRLVNIVSMTKKATSHFIVIALVMILFTQSGYAFAIVRPLHQEAVAVNPTSDFLKASVFITLSPQEFAAASGAKLNLFQKGVFKLIQRQLRRELVKNPDLLITDYYDQKTKKFKLDPLWFVIGAFIGPIGVLLSYYSHKQKKGSSKKDRTTSAWLGFGLFVIWFGLIFIF